MTTGHAAKLLNVHVTTVRKLIHDGVLSDVSKRRGRHHAALDDAEVRALAHSKRLLPTSSEQAPTTPSKLMRDMIKLGVQTRLAQLADEARQLRALLDEGATVQKKKKKSARKPMSAAQRRETAARMRAHWAARRAKAVAA